MKMLIGFISTFLCAFLLWNSPSFAQSPADCIQQSVKFPGFNFHRFETYQGRCLVSTIPLVGNYTYRSLSYYADGRFMNFNSYEGMSATDGARSFFFFPRTRNPWIEVTPTEVVIHTATEGIAVHYSQAGYQILGMTGGDMIQDPKVHPDNNGGIELRNVQALVLDAGFLIGEDPTSQPSRKIKFIDLQQRTCTVRVRDVFRYEGDNPRFKFTDAELKTYLARKCPNLRVHY